MIEELEPVLRRTGHIAWLAWTVFESAFTAVAAADWDEAGRRIADAVSIGRRFAVIHSEPYFVAHLGWVSRLHGQLDTAVEQGRSAVAMVPPQGQAWNGPVAGALLAGTLMERGEVAEAVALLERAVDHRRARRARRHTGCVAWHRSRRQRDRPRSLPRPIRCWLGSRRLPDRRGCSARTPTWSVARAWLTRDEPVRARAVLVPLLVAARRLGWIPATAAGGLVDGHAGTALGDPGARAALAAVAELATAHRMPLIAQAARAALR